MAAKKIFSGFVLACALSSPVAAQNPPPVPPPQPPPAQPPTTPPTTQVITPAGRTAAQDAAATMGRNVSNDQISTAIRQSGLSEQQIRARLQAAGYDPSLADPFFRAVQGAQPGPPGQPMSDAQATANNQFARALASLGLMSIGANLPEGTTEETARRSGERVSARAGGVFGKDIFDRASTAFDPVTSGPVDPAYRLGIGDQLQVIVTGQVELAYQLELRRDGTVVIPQVGQLSLAGLTLDAARTLLRDRMGNSYSGLRSGEARLDLSIARLRSNAVFVIGEVEEPGAIQVNALATVFHALARAGGPTDRGSFRDVEVRRAGRVVQRLDLYDYLLKGDASGDIRLEQSDFIYVGLNRRVVAVTGAIRRPRIFELRDSEGFSDLLGFAGGLLPSASVERVQIDRILPPEQRAPGKERVKVDVEIKGDLSALSGVRLLDGDIVTVFTIGDLRRNVVSIFGQVFQPGEYELKPRLTLGGLVTDAQGLMPWALVDRIKIVRQLPLTGQTQLFTIDQSTAAGRDFELQEFDVVEVLDSRLAYPLGDVSVGGAVNLPATRRFSQNESLRDAIERSGGLREDAQRVEVYRRRTGASYSDTTSVLYRFDVSPATFASDPALARFTLERDDRIFVLSSPGFRPQRFVSVSGRFRYPGTFAITENVDRVSDVVRRAGDVLPGAYPESFRLNRGGRVVSVDFARAMRGDREANLFVLDGDGLVIDQDPRTVFVTGAVTNPALLRFQRGLSVQDYIDRAGGVVERGDARKAVVSYPSGFSRPVKKVALFFHASPEVVSGSVIAVPLKPERTTTSSEVWARVLSTTSVLASLIVAYAAITR